ncbi:MAG: radical SAM protein [Thermoplasmata archaeon]|nr:MAG: radical SAM protein [Thermoplasmata archaeon]KAA0010589.1 MAG: radical SAM protein [Thermoplasmata archaeon]
MLLIFVLISPFDPWKSKLCTCPKKYSFSPYTGCSHACIYCYITSYIPNAFQARLKKKVFQRLKKELKKVDTYISMANSGDAYTPEEKELMVTRKCLKIMKEKDVNLLVITKSDIVARDVDILQDMKASVSITITTLDEEKAKIFEPFAPLPAKRIKALEKLYEHAIPCSVRIDPIIPGINDGEVEEIVKEISPFASHVIASTLKPRNDAIRRLEKIFDIRKYNWKKVGSSFYLPREERFKMLKKVEEACRKHGLSFATCREGYKFNSESCDGSHLIPR